MNKMDQMGISQAITDCLTGKEDKNNIFPFLWVHGAPRDRLQQELDAIYECGLRAFCVESRPHPQFCEDGWWEDLGFILSYARQRQMQVWVLDDKHFPTGYANQAIEKKYPQLRRKCVRVACVDVAGPMKNGCCLLPQMDADESLVSVSAFRRTGENEQVDGNTGMALTNIRDGLVFWDVPEGVWRIFYVIRTNRGPAHFKYYIDMCDAESCQVMLKEIYEPHYAHFGEYFGNTFRGFFSDEPCFANNIGSFTDTLGTPLLNIPWREDMPQLLAQECQMSPEQATMLLPALWYPVTEHMEKLRLGYMNIITGLYKTNFSHMLGAWCEAHGVEYIGHVIEDQGAHMRLGYGSGHFFRAQEGQHMAGMDIVLHQIVPGITDMAHTYVSASGKQAHPDGFHFTIPKLATSAAHLDRKKQGRVMCELYGAFGWAEGVGRMKYLTDCMLSAGVNRLVPHAFSDKCEDPDCPPHFFNGGNNPQFPAFSALMDYSARLCHILSSGEPQISVAVYYPAESEWCGGECAPLQQVAGILGRCHTDFDFVPMDLLLTADAENGRLAVAQQRYAVLILPYSQIIPAALAHKLNELAQAGMLIFYLDGKPEKTENGVCPWLSGAVIASRELPGFIEKYRWASVRVNEPELRVLHRIDGEHTLLFFFNAGMQKAIDTWVEFPGGKQPVAYDAWRNLLEAVPSAEGKYRLLLEPGQAVLWCSAGQSCKVTQPVRNWQTLRTGPVQLTLEQQGKVVYQQQYAGLPDMNFAELFPEFSGVIRYEFTCKCPLPVQSLRLQEVGETACLWVNGVPCGSAVSAPYVFSVPGWHEGDNQICIQVAVNQAYGRRDRFSVNAVLPPMGLTGPIWIA